MQERRKMAHVLSQSAASRAYAGTYMREWQTCWSIQQSGVPWGVIPKQQGWEAVAGEHNFIRHVDMQCSQTLCSANLRHILPPPSTPSPLSAPSSSRTLNGSLSIGHKTGASAAGGYGAYGGNRQRSLGADAC